MMSGIPMPMHVTTNTFNSSSDSDITLELRKHIKQTSAMTTPSDSGLGNSELDTDKTQDNSISSTPRQKLSQSVETTENGNINSTSVSLNVSHKSTTTDKSCKGSSKSYISTLKLSCLDYDVSNTQRNSNTLRNKKESILKVKFRSKDRKQSKSTISGKSEKRELNWMDLRGGVTQSATNAAHADDYDWNLVERELSRFRTNGYDPDEAIMALLSSLSSTPASGRIDWRVLTKATNHSVSTNNDFFSVYPWSTRKTSSSRLGDYFQQYSRVNSVDKLNDDIDISNESLRKDNSGPTGALYTQNSRGYLKKGKSKTPGELAIAEGRSQNSKEPKQIKNGITLGSTSHKRNSSLPNIRQQSSLSSSSVHSSDNPFKLPEIPTNKSLNTGKTYSRITRLKTPMSNQQSGLKTASSVPSLHETIGKETYPLQVKNYGIPTEQSLSYTPVSKISLHRSTTDLNSESHNFPLIKTDRENTSPQNFTKKQKPLLIQKMTGEHYIGHRVLLQTLNSRRSTEPPKPPPVTPNVKHKESTDGVSDQLTFVEPSSPAVKHQTSLLSQKSDSTISSESDDGLNDGCDDKSSIHSLSTMRSHIVKDTK